MSKYQSTINGGLRLHKQATNLAGAVQPMIPYLKRGDATYLRSTAGTVVVTFRGFPPEATATNSVGNPVDLPDWAVKALRMLDY